MKATFAINAKNDNLNTIAWLTCKESEVEDCIRSLRDQLPKITDLTWTKMHPENLHETMAESGLPRFAF